MIRPPPVAMFRIQHACVGISLARLEGKVAIERFLRRFPAYELAGEPRRGGRARFRGFLALPVRGQPGVAPR